MCITRRHILALAGSSLVSRVLAATLPGTSGQTTFGVDRLLNTNTGNAGSLVGLRRYVASATVTLFSIPLVTKNSVGSGYAVVEEADTADGRALGLQFGAGSWPASARGLNRLGYIQEAVLEEHPGRPVECAWLAFMTTSQEKNLEQAKKALEASGAMVPYSASQGYGRKGKFSSRVDRLEFASQYTWRDITQLVEKARGAMTAGAADEPEPSLSQADRPATFLYAVWRAMLDPRPSASGSLVFNKKQFQLDTQKERDSAATTYFVQKRLVPESGFVTRMNATLTEKLTGEKTPFRLWYEAGAGQKPPLRFEYHAKSFLRLTFEADLTADTPPIQFAFKTSKENA